MTTNPALAELQFLAGAWDMELSGASFLSDPDATVHGTQEPWIRCPVRQDCQVMRTVEDRSALCSPR